MDEDFERLLREIESELKAGESLVSEWERSQARGRQVFPADRDDRLRSRLSALRQMADKRIQTAEGQGQEFREVADRWRKEVLKEIRKLDKRLSAMGRRK